MVAVDQMKDKQNASLGGSNFILINLFNNIFIISLLARQQFRSEIKLIMIIQLIESNHDSHQCTAHKIET